MVLNATLNKISKGEVEQVFSGKADKRDIDNMLRSLQSRIDEELATMAECIVRKANTDDL